MIVNINANKKDDDDNVAALLKSKKKKHKITFLFFNKCYNIAIRAYKFET